MPDDEDDSQLTEKELALDQRVEKVMLEFQEKNNGEFPTRKQIWKILGGSYRDLNPSAGRVRSRLEATQSRLAKQPEIPDELRRSGEQWLNSLWLTAREMADTEVVDLRLAQETRDAAHRRNVEELEEALYTVEADRDAETGRADTAEQRVSELERDLRERTRECDMLQARLDERTELLEHLRISAADGANKGDKSKHRPGRAKGDQASPDDEPFTPELPME